MPLTLYHPFNNETISCSDLEILYYWFVPDITRIPEEGVARRGSLLIQEVDGELAVMIGQTLSFFEETIEELTPKPFGEVWTQGIEPVSITKKLPLQTISRDNLTGFIYLLLFSLSKTALTGKAAKVRCGASLSEGKDEPQLNLSCYKTSFLPGRRALEFVGVVSLGLSAWKHFIPTRLLTNKQLEARQNSWGIQIFQEIDRLIGSDNFRPEARFYRTINSRQSKPFGLIDNIAPELPGFRFFSNLFLIQT